MSTAKHVLVIGAGPAGLTSAAYLADRGVKVTVVERDVFPRTIIGESLLPVSMDHFKEVGFYDALNAANFALKPGARFIRDKKRFDILFDNQFTEGASTWTWQVPREDFDSILANETMKKGVKIEFGANITSLSVEDEVSISYEKDGKSEKVVGDFIIDSSGFGCVVPKMIGQPVKAGFTPNCSVFTHVEDKNRDQFEEAERISFEVLDLDLWFWMIPFSNGKTSIGFAGHSRHFNKDNDDQHAYFKKLLEQSDEFYERFKDCDLLFDPKWHWGYSQTTESWHGKNYVMVGNCVEFLDPIFSSGVALATSSAMVAAPVVLKEINGEAPDWDKEYVEPVMWAIDVFKTYVEAWYNGKLQELFFTDAKLDPMIKKQVTSVLAGYVWDMKNPFIRRHHDGLDALSKVLSIK